MFSGSYTFDFSDAGCGTHEQDVRVEHPNKSKFHVLFTIIYTPCTYVCEAGRSQWCTLPALLLFCLNVASPFECVQVPSPLTQTCSA